MPHSTRSSCPATLTRQLMLALALMIFTVWLAPSAQAAGSAPRFRTAPSYPVNGTQPRSIAAGDFNGDGLPDLATVNYNSNNASILLNQGGGVYGAPSVFAVGALPSFIVARDFNSDGKLDLAITNSGDDNVSILLGLGNGSFNAATNYATGATPAAIAVGDFNGDAQLDLAIANGGTTFLSILLGTGSGSFTAAANVPVIGAEGGGMMSVAAGDLNNDGKLDLVVPEYGSSTRTVSILPGVGNGTFGAKKIVNNVGNPYWPADAAVVDINGDGNQDIVTTIFTNNGSNFTGSVLVIFGNGTHNTSGNTAAYGLNGGDPIKLAVADFNADGKPDVATADYGVATTAVSVLLNSGATGITNNFGSEAVYIVSGVTPIALAPADLNGDGRLDLAAATYNSNNVSLLFNSGGGRFRAPVRHSIPFTETGNTVYPVTTADFNTDGKPDVLTVAGNRAVVQLNDGMGGFGQPILTGLFSGLPVALADFNTDGKVDMASLDNQFNVYVALGNGDGTFGAKKQFGVGSFPKYIAAGDFNGDGKPDLAVAANSVPNSITILLGTGNGNFTFLTNYTLPTGANFIITKDFNNDGKLDLAASLSSTNPGGTFTLLGNGDGTFTQTSAHPGGARVPTYLLAADFNLDGNQDLATLNAAPNNVLSIFLGLGNGSFVNTPTNYTVGANPQTLAVADFNADGIPDLITADQAASNVNILAGLGNGTFNAPLSIFVAANPTSVAVADFNLDGRLDFVTAHSPVTSSLSGGLTVVLGGGGKTQVADFDGDGATDISVWDPNNGNWYIYNSHDNSLRTQVDWGRASLGDIPVPADYDGDGKTDIAIFRPSEGNWYVIRSSDNGVTVQNWGGPNDRPARADFDGDGKTDFAVFRPSEGNWYILKSSNGTSSAVGWGVSTDKLVAGDYDGDGRADVAVWRPSESIWYIIKSSGGVIQRQWGLGADVPVPGDYDNDGRTDIAVFRPSEGNWYILNSSTGGASIRNWGNSDDVPVPGDYDNDGRTDVAIYRPSDNNWYIIPSSTSVPIIRALGVGNDVPVPSTYIPYQSFAAPCCGTIKPPAAASGGKQSGNKAAVVNKK